MTSAATAAKAFGDTYLKQFIELPAWAVAAVFILGMIAIILVASADITLLGGTTVLLLLVVFPSGARTAREDLTRRTSHGLGSAAARTSTSVCAKPEPT